MAEAGTAKKEMRMKLRSMFVGVLSMAALMIALAASPAAASQAITNFESELSTSQAGAHPDIHTSFTLDSPGVPESAAEIELQMPEGVFGNPGAGVKCPPATFALNKCAPGAQVGLVRVRASFEGDPDHLMGTAPVLSLSPRSSEEAALLAFVVPAVGIPITIPVRVRTGSDYGLSFKVSGISQQLPLAGIDLTIWGDPFIPGRSTERFPSGSPGNPPGCVESTTTGCIPGPPFPESGQSPVPFTSNPSNCDGAPLPVRLRVWTYQDPDNPSSAETTYPPTTGCESQRFDPVFTSVLTTNEADSPSGLDLTVAADQFLAGSPSPSSIRSAVISLPDGLNINPDAADGQSSCSDGEAGFGSEAPSRCPDNAKIGTVEVTTPALPGPLTGSLYIGRPLPGNQYRVFMIFDGYGIFAKLEARIQPDPSTGQLTVRLDGLPQVPFEEFNLHLFASDRGLVATPTRCGIFAADAEITPWNQRLAPQQARGFIDVNSGPGGAPCPGVVRPFNPRLAAGASNPSAGAFSSFHLKLDRDDGDQFLGDLDFRLPPGFTGSLRGIGYCPEAQILAAARNSGLAERTAPSCPASSFVGTTNVQAGPGNHPFNAVGRMYLSGPFRGAPLSLAAVTPALAGPYDYGVVVVRVALHVDPLTAQVTAVSDRMPQIIGGIPIRMRSIQVNIDRPNFTINPTNCDQFAIVSHGIGDQGTSTEFSSPFQAINCATLPFKPSMRVTQIGRRATTRTTNPQLRFDLRTRPGDANIKSLSVTLPSAFNIDQSNLGNICSEKELAEKGCAGRSPIGRATTRTPLLDQPLTGPVYAVSGGGGLPRLAFVLDGQVSLMPRARTRSVVKKGVGRLRTTVPVVPDAPIGRFQLTVFGGKNGYLVNTRDLCRRPSFVKVAYTAQNTRTKRQRIRVKTACRKIKRQSKRHRRG